MKGYLKYIKVLMQSESEYMKEMAMRVAVMRVCIKRPESGIPHIPDDIYSIIMGIYAKEYRAEPIRSNYHEVDIPACLYDELLYKLTGKYGRPFIIRHNMGMSWNYGPDIVTYDPIYSTVVTRSRDDNSFISEEIVE